MLSIIGAVLGPLLSFITKVGGYVAAYFAGKSSEQRRALKEENKVLKEQGKIDAQKPASRQEILDKMKNNDF